MAGSIRLDSGGALNRLIREAQQLAGDGRSRKTGLASQDKGPGVGPLSYVCWLPGNVRLRFGIGCSWRGHLIGLQHWLFAPKLLWSTNASYNRR